MCVCGGEGRGGGKGGVDYCQTYFLMGIDGGHKSESSAKAICTDVSKYLKYACGEGELSLSRLLDRDFLALYI